MRFNIVWMRRLQSFVQLIACIGFAAAWLEDRAIASWTTFQHDNARSGATEETLPAALAQAWVFRSTYPPRPAWDEPAIWDGWSKTHNLTNRQVFDKAFHVAAVGDSVFFGSSVEDQVICLNATTGDRRWTFFTEGPVRLAPTFSNGRLYVGCDDGFVYCLDAKSGAEIWRHRAGTSDRRLAGNGRVISHWPIRTGIVIEGDRVYFGAGVIPSDGVFVCAVNSRTGAEVWKTEMRDLPAQGYLLASTSRVYVVTARDRPVVFDASSGERLHQVAGGTGGTYALLTGDSLIYGPNKTGEVSLVGPGKQDVLASFAGNHMIVAKPLSYLHSGDTLSGLDREGYVQRYRERTEAMAARQQLVAALKKLQASDRDSASANSGGADSDSNGSDASGSDANDAAASKPNFDEAVAKLNSEVKSIDERLKKINEDLQACLKWTTECDCPLSLILAGDTLIAGGDGLARGYDATTGKRKWSHAVPGRAYGLAVAEGRLLISTDRGSIHSFADASNVSSDARVTADTQNTAAVRVQAYLGPFATHQPPPAGIVGPIAEFVQPTVARISWQTTQPMSSKLLFGQDLTSARPFEDKTPKTAHSFDVEGVEPNVMYQYQVGGSRGAVNDSVVNDSAAEQNADGTGFLSEAYRFDAHFNYLPVETAVRESPFADDATDQWYREFAASILNRLNRTRGYALVIGSERGQLAYHLAIQSDLQIVVVETDPSAVAENRRRLSAASLYGSRVSVHLRSSYDALPYGPFLANLIVSDRMLSSGTPPTSLANLYPCLRPVGGMIVWGSRTAMDDEAWKTERLITFSSDDDSPSNASAPRVIEWHDCDWENGAVSVHERGKLAGTGEWTHQYATPDNSSCSQDEVLSGELTAQWWGKPGARPMPDRGGRNPPPVSAHGRLYIQGNRTLFGLDAYNGTILWAKQIPNMRRANMPRDGSNMVAVGEQVWISTGSQCLGFDGETGAPTIQHDVPRPTSNSTSAYDWGYVARVGEDLVGSGVRPNSQYRGDAGEWYEGAAQKDVARVTSDFLFANPWYGGPTRWVYQQGVILNSTITIADNVAYLIESRNPAAKSAPSGRLLEEVLSDQVLVALDMHSGQIKWQRPYDFSKCHHVTYMTHSKETLLVAGTDPDRNFYTYAFDSSDGRDLWQHEAPDKKGHHTGQLAHPTIVGDVAYFNKHAFDLRTGTVLNVHDFNWHGCGVMSASNHTIFSRYEYHGTYDLKTKKRTELLGIRSGCWLSLIPSGGLLLAPETSAGCSCGHSLQTSIAYVPRALIGF